MPDNDPVNNAPHLHHRLGVDLASHPNPIGVSEHSAAIAFEGHVRDGDAGAVRRLVHEIEFSLGPHRANPHRLLEHLADRAIGRQQETAAEPATAAAVTQEPASATTS
jgi:hypothetical protein